MRIVHTSDWHLGQTFYHYQRDVEHQAFLAWLIDQLEQTQPDVLVIAGDVFDGVNPSISAQRMLYDFLAQLHRRFIDLQVCLIAGNHDSGTRLELPVPLLASMRVHVVGRVHWQNDQPDWSSLWVPITRAGALMGHVLLLPFLRPAEVTALGAESSLMQATQDLYAQMNAWIADHHQDLPVVWVNHAHVQGGLAGAESERNLIIGHAEAISAAWFEQADYVALGHLHRPQQIRAQNSIHYSGSPLPLSLSERTYQHHVLLADLARGQPPTLQSLPIPRLIAMHRVPTSQAASLDEVRQMLTEMTWPEVIDAQHRAWLEVSIRQQGPVPPDLRQSLEALLPMDRVRLLRVMVTQQAEFVSDEDGRDHPPLVDGLPTPEQLFAQIWERQYGQADAAVYADFAALLHEVLHDEHQA